MVAAVERFHVMFHSEALSPGDLLVRSMSGEERLGALYEFHLDVQTTFGGALEADVVDEVLQAPAWIAFGEAEEHKIHGFVRAVEMISTSDPAVVRYRLLLVPRLWNATQVFGSWIYQDLSVPDIAKDVFKDLGFREGTDFEFRLTERHPVREYTVQFEETDLQFVLRLCEHEGITVWFEQGDAQEKIILSDANNAYQPLAGHEEIPYEVRGGVVDERESMVSLDHMRRTVPAIVNLRDYNYRTPDTPLLANSPADERGVGHHTYYSEHFKDDAEGRRLARRRAQEHLVRRETFSATSRVRGLRAGHRFTLAGHPLAALDVDSLVTSVLHSVVQGDAGEASEGYTNRVTAIRAETVHRPQRLTPKPRLTGLMHAKIDGTANGAAAPLDAQGRYKVLMPFDNGQGPPGGRSSRWIRMVQSSSGDGYGIHFPLHIGTEVMIAHVDGDPDRPVIVGSVPNPSTPTTVSRGNATQSVMRTRAGIRLEFEDDQ